MKQKRVIQVLFLLFILGNIFHQPAYAESLEPENRLNDATKVVNEMRLGPDGGIPRDLLRRSKAIIIFPSVIKAGMGIGGQYGKGVALRRDASERKWGPPAFVTLIGGSFGWQLGVQSTDLVLLVMSDVNLKNIFNNRFTIGVDASVAAGPIGRDASAETDTSLATGILSYSHAKGLFAGLTIQGGVMEADMGANKSYYGSDVSIVDIFFHKQGTVSPGALKLIKTLNRSLSN